jgi:ribosomal-protein-alanine N-acetyltransferase
MLGARVPIDWPSQDLLDLLPFYADQLTADPGWRIWGVWLMIDTSTQTLVGDLGFKGPPDKAGTVEIGYGVLPAFQRQGYATEAVRALVRWAFEQPDVQRVVAECLADNLASIRVLHHVGMRPLPPEGQMLRWELRRSAVG